MTSSTCQVTRDALSHMSPWWYGHMVELVGSTAAPLPNHWVSASPLPCTWWKCRRAVAGSRRNHPGIPVVQREPRARCRAVMPGRWWRQRGTEGSGSGTSRRGRRQKTSPWRHDGAVWEHPGVCPSTRRWGWGKCAISQCKWENMEQKGLRGNGNERAESETRGVVYSQIWADPRTCGYSR